MIDLNPEHLQIIKKILAEHVSKHEIWAFGSRVTGTAKKFSDLDLVVITDKPLPVLTMALLKESFSESDLPFKVDILDWSTISDNFKQLITKQHVEFFMANQL